MLEGRSRELDELRGELVELRREAKKPRPRQPRPTADVEPEIELIGGVNVIAQAVEGLSADALLDLSDRFKQRQSPAAVVLGSRENGTVHLVANFDDAVAEKVRAGDVVREIAPIVGGGGGGRPTMARAGGKDPAKLADALARARELIAAALVCVKVLALDFGSARTGVAVSDPTGTVARPVGVVRKAATDAGFESLLTVIREEEPALVVVGHAADAARRARRAGAGDRRVRRAAPGGGRAAGRDLRRALHLRPRRRRRRARGRAPALRLPRSGRAAATERAGRAAPGSSRVGACSSSPSRRSPSRSRWPSRTATTSDAPPPPPPPPKPFRIVFPEGFTRAQMAAARRGGRADRRRASTAGA